jgi:RHS repeat-associated protein
LGRIGGALLYYFHSDHLVSSSLITDATGGIVQHLEYIPFGEVFIDERAATSTWSTPYKFNAKELDEETGLYYYGARYYDPRTSVWISKDPLAEKYPNVSSYVYCLNNPVKLIDPNGKEIFFFKERFNAVSGNIEFQNVSFLQLDNNSKEIFYADALRNAGKDFLQNYVSGEQTFALDNSNSVTLQGNGTNYDASYYFDSGSKEFNTKTLMMYDVNGSTSWDIDETSVAMKIHVNVDKQNIYEAAYTYGHEEELHAKKELTIVKNNFVKGSKLNASIESKFSSVHEDHKNHAENKGQGSKGFKLYLAYMKGWVWWK